MRSSNLTVLPCASSNIICQPLSEFEGLIFVWSDGCDFCDVVFANIEEIEVKRPSASISELMI